MNLINVEKIYKEPNIALAPDMQMQYTCPICLRQFEGSKVVEKEMRNEGKDFFTRYAGQLVNHITKTHMVEYVDKLYKEFKSKEKNEKLRFEITYGQHLKMNKMSKNLILDEVPKKFPRTVAVSLIKAMIDLKDNDKKIKKMIQSKILEMEALE